ncbi:phosphoglycerate mutase-like protein [Myriangium duriaei CBS 260.36]|uniref:3-phytase n=1 Tax=Myriangium duriaei CBS 260.36 TaxID=1168546 RepID=A0A9P4MPB5_9PEZI|nr:phosphoglycerate mutase-like protein [Myriangium duriaei CBS 260.36]
MAHFQGRRGPPVSQYIANLNTVPSATDIAHQQQHQQEFANFDDDIALFTNTDFFDFDLHSPELAFNNGQQQRSAPSPVAMNQPGNYYHHVPQYTPTGHLSAPNSLPSSPPNGLPFAGQLQQSQPTVPSAHHFAALLSPQQQQAMQQQAGQKRKAGSISAGSIPNPVELEDSSRAAAEEDKRRRNTAASARFRVKKKQREQALEKTAKEMSDRVQVLEARIGQLEMENQWLKGLITEKNVKVDSAPAGVKPESAQDKEETAVAGKKGVKVGKNEEKKENEELVQVETSLPEKKRGVVFAYQCPSNGLCLRDTLQHVQHIFFSKHNAIHDEAPPPPTKPWNILYHLGGNSPWIPKTTNIIASAALPPPGCHVEQVHMLSRHGERYPTLKAGIRMLELYHRLSNTATNFTGPLSFLNTYNFFMPDPATRLETLVPVGPYAGTLQSFSTGTKFRTRYETLIASALARNQTRLWASGSPRVAETARYFAAGLYGLDWSSKATLQVIPETPDLGADTLTPGDTCPLYRSDTTAGHDAGYARLAEWQAVYLPPIAARLSALAPDLVFSEAEVYTMQEMCGFELLSRGESPWCGLFTPAEWEDFEYARDVLHFYRSGPGGPYGAAMGWLWLNATLDLLQSEVDDVGALFFSFAHDGDIVPLLAALDVLHQDPPLATDRLEGDRTWRTSDVVPMGGRVVLERLACRAQECWSNAPFYPNHVYCTEEREERYVRIGINDGVVPVPGCQDGPGGSCALGEFGEYVARRGREVGDFRTVCGLSEEARNRISFLKQPPYRGGESTPI